ncbi:MAG: 23S rRNA (adenine(2503)-C(2))-methyltransferase RlmN, partial [Candidatus Aenigmatarchaeota archaeon]
RKDALELAKILKGINCKLNLIPCNLNFYNFEKPNEEELSIFKEELKKNKIFFTFRESRGSDINAGCGQLKALWEAKCLE